tara:strand:+ start:62 stop:400 length:339 start_codon:yes stop_codon:yes gene_type:complete
MKSILGLITAFSFSLCVLASNCDKPISKDRFEGLYNSIVTQKNDQQRYQLVLAFANRECVSVNQMIEFLSLVSDHKIKFSLVKDTYNLLFDADNRSLLLTEFSEHEQMLIKK